MLRSFTQQKVNNGDSGTTAAACSAPDWSMSHYIPLENSASVMRPFVKILWPPVTMEDTLHHVVSCFFFTLVECALYWNIDEDRKSIELIVYSLKRLCSCIFRHVPVMWLASNRRIHGLYPCSNIDRTHDSVSRDDEPPSSHVPGTPTSVQLHSIASFDLSWRKLLFELIKYRVVLCTVVVRLRVGRSRFSGSATVTVSF